MQTFLPYPSFIKTAIFLDYRRLGKQRVEALQIYKILTVDKTSRWRNHPAVKMWEGYEECLSLYYNTIILGWVNRGYKNKMKLLYVKQLTNYPWWWGNTDFHRAMRSRLIAKNPEYYRQRWPDDENFNGGKYLWPDNKTKTFRMIN